MFEATPHNIVAGRIVWAEPGLLLACRGRRILASRNSGETWQVVARLELGWRDRIASMHRWTRRLLRRDVHHIVGLGDGRFLMCAYKGFHVLDVKRGTATRSGGHIQGSRPLSFVRSRGRVYYGEYRSNPERSGVSVWCSEDEGRTWRAAWRFEGVRHIHGVYPDPYDDSLWVTTGDLDQECALWRSQDDFRTVDRVVGGSQRLRVVQLLFTPDAVLFGSDAPNEANHLQRMERGSWRIHAVQAVGGPVFYGAEVGQSRVFGTVVEPSSTNLGRNAEVWGSSDGGIRWDLVASFRKDLLHRKLFQYGQVLFPAGPGDGSLWLTPYATVHDQHSLNYVRRASDA